MGQMKLAQLCEALSDAGLPARFERDDRLISGVNTLDDAVSGELSFLSNPKYHRSLQTSKAAAVIEKRVYSVTSSESECAKLNQKRLRMS